MADHRTPERALADTLKKYWGYNTFRELQLDIMLSVLRGDDTLALMPTGGGKSICFQVPTLVLGGMTVVVTPLVSLMKDQVDNLRLRRIKAVYLHAGMTSREIRIAWEHIMSGTCRFLYVSPERLQNERFCAELAHLDIRLIVVDEAHCISQWGYDFRPSYLRIARLRKIIPGVSILALTATATPLVAIDICEKLGFRHTNILKKSFARPNISYIVRRTPDREGQMLRILNNTKGSAIVYVRSRIKTRQVAEYLRSMGIDAVNFHAGLSYEEKEERQNRWKQSSVRVIVATNAFGMGIDKPDVRVVIHYGLPPSLEEYYQEAGRAGRDSKPAYAVLLANDRDLTRLRNSVEEAFPPKDVIRKIYERVCNFLNVSLDEGFMKFMQFDLDAFCQTFSYDHRLVLAALRILGNSGYMTFSVEGEPRSRLMIVVDRHELYDICVSEDASRLLGALMRTYTGLFVEYVYISENEMARELDVDEHTVYTLLLELARAHVIHYIPKNRLPHIYFDTSREEPDKIVISREAYEYRKETMKKRVDAMLEYTTRYSDCRVEYMLEYFGDAEAHPCGHCDICREKKRLDGRSGPAEIADAMLNFIYTYSDPVTLPVIHRFFGNTPDSMAVLRWLCSENYVQLKEEVYSVVNRK